MRVHWLQHAEHEGLGCIAPWLAARGHRVRCSRLHAGDDLPGSTDFDWLVVMGGPMNIYEHGRYPWLINEKALIRDARKAGKKILGICLGAQLLADVMGGRVAQNPEREIGWFPVNLTEEGRRSPLFDGLPDRFEAFHWHEDTFALPDGASHLMKSDACVNQAFEVAPLSLGLQFHLEVTHADARRWLEQETLAPGRYVQANAEILREPSRFEENNRWMVSILERFAAA